MSRPRYHVALSLFGLGFALNWSTALWRVRRQRDRMARPSNVKGVIDIFTWDAFPCRSYE